MSHLPKVSSPQPSRGRGLQPNLSNFRFLWLPPCVSLQTHLPTPQVADLAGAQQEDIVGIEGGGSGWHLCGLGVHLIRAPHLEEADGRLGAALLSPARAALQGQRGEGAAGRSGGHTHPGCD